MKREVGQAQGQQHHGAHVRTYTIRVAPRSWLGRTVAAALAVLLVVLALMFFSFLVAIGAFLVALAVAYAVIRSAVGGARSPPGRPGAGGGRIIDTESAGTADDGRPGDSSRP